MFIVVMGRRVVAMAIFGKLDRRVDGPSQACFEHMQTVGDFLEGGLVREHADRGEGGLLGGGVGLFVGGRAAQGEGLGKVVGR
jgi:hypothetical protein